MWLSARVICSRVFSALMIGRGEKECRPLGELGFLFLINREVDTPCVYINPELVLLGYGIFIADKESKKWPIM